MLHNNLLFIRLYHNNLLCKLIGVKYLTEIVVIDMARNAAGTYVAKAGKLVKDNERVIKSSFMVAVVLSLLALVALGAQYVPVHASADTFSDSINKTFTMVATVLDDSATLVPNIVNFVTAMIPLIIIGVIIGVIVVILSMISIVCMVVVSYMESGIGGMSGRSGGRRSRRSH